MQKMLLVLKHEFITTISRRSFLLTLFLVPIASFLVVLVVGAINENSESSLVQFFISQPKKVIEGYVDEAGIIDSLPPDMKANRLKSFASQIEARQALDDGQITGYYVVPQDYLEIGKVIYFRSDFNPLTGIDDSEIFRQVLTYNLLGQDELLAKLMRQPLDLTEENISPVPIERDQDNILTYFLPYIVMMIFYVVILTAAGLMLNSVNTEKENRVMEILVASITPTQILSGKIIALGILGLLQTIIWSGSGYLLLRVSGRAFHLPPGMQMPASLLIWGVVFFILGYAVYASLLAGVGALVPNLREASQATTVVIMPLIVPLILNNVLIMNPEHPLSIALSIFPLTSPLAMMTRLATNIPVPAWQIALSIVLLMATAYLIIRSVAGMFRAQTLLTGQHFSLKVFLRALAGKA